MKTDQQNSGTLAELAVAADLQSRGLILLAHQYKVPRLGEIDLIMQRADEIFFIEVKSRTHQDLYGGGLDAITPHKLKCIKQTALYYAQKNHYMNNPLRFLAVSVQLKSDLPVKPYTYAPID